MCRHAPTLIHRSYYHQVWLSSGAKLQRIPTQKHTHRQVRCIHDESKRLNTQNYRPMYLLRPVVHGRHTTQARLPTRGASYPARERGCGVVFATRVTIVAAVTADTTTLLSGRQLRFANVITARRGGTPNTTVCGVFMDIGIGPPQADKKLAGVNGVLKIG